jgi:proteic killer suppression protein
MIKSFRHKGLEKFFYFDDPSGVQPQHIKKLRLRLTMLNQAQLPQDIDVPGWRLHSLKGSLSTFWAIQVDANWRLTFKFSGRDVELLNYVDYH